MYNVMWLMSSLACNLCGLGDDFSTLAGSAKAACIKVLNSVLVLLCWSSVKLSAYARVYVCMYVCLAHECIFMMRHVEIDVPCLVSCGTKLQDAGIVVHIRCAFRNNFRKIRKAMAELLTEIEQVRPSEGLE